MDPVTIILVLVLAGILVAAGVAWQRGSKVRAERELADARADAQRWYERLGGQVLSLATTDDRAVTQALSDASERYTAAGSAMEQASSPRQYALAKDTAVEGLHYIRAARLGMGMDAGPELPQTEAQRTAGVVTQEREATVDGETLKASPRYGSDTPYYYPGGHMQGRNVPAGYYSQPWWKTAVASGAGVLGAMMLFDALFVPDYGGFDGGMADGGDYGDGDYGDGGGDWGSDMGGDIGGDMDFDF